jgi:hypothetical protein
VLESFDALRILAEANRYSHLSGTERAKAESDGRLRKRKHARGAELVVPKRRVYAVRSCKSVDVYDASTEEWRTLPDMNVEKRNCAAVCIDGNVFVMGGQNRNCYLRNADKNDGNRWGSGGLRRM